MIPTASTHRLLLNLSIATLLAVFTPPLSIAQDLTPGLVYVCNGEKLAIDSCNIRDTSDTSRCMIGHPDHVMPNGLMQYTYMTRAEMKKLFPTCTQPTAKNSAAAHAFQQKQQDTYNANAKRAEDQLNAPPPAPTANPEPPAQSLHLRTPKSVRCAAASALADFPPVAPATSSSAPSARCSTRSHLRSLPA